jgi:hypothetical protein
MPYSDAVVNHDGAQSLSTRKMQFCFPNTIVMQVIDVLKYLNKESLSCLFVLATQYTLHTHTPEALDKRTGLFHVPWGGD